MKIDLKDCVLDHVAIAVEDLENSVKTYTALGLHFAAEREEVPSEQVITAFAAIDENAHLELLAPTAADSAIGKYLSKKGPGIHHLCFRVPNVREKQVQLQSQGFQFIYKEPTQGAGNCLVNFIHPKSTGGVLIEISQKLKE